MRRGAGDRRQAERRGRLGEWAALAFLMAKGYRILGRRVRTGFGEIDLAALKSGVLIIVEVKARRTARAGLFAVSPQQQERIAAAAASAAARWGLGGKPVRFDLVVVDGWRILRHERGAWDQSGDRDRHR